MRSGTQRIRIGSVCSGYGGLDMAVAQVFDGEVAWFFEYEAAPSAILAFHWPEIPNYGDLTQANWDRIERVRVMCGGTPCQDLSAAGKRAGMTEGTRSNLWVQMREGIAIQQPDYVVWENVRGAYSVGADSEVEREEGLLGGTPGGSLRALGRVLGDLSSLGYDAEVVPLRASDVGAPHARYRVFVIARRQTLADSGRVRGERRRNVRNLDGASAADDRQGDQRQWNGDAVDDSGSVDWAEFEPAIRRWERCLERLAPAPTESTAPNGARMTSPRFVEWMMGLPEGHVTAPEIWAGMKPSKARKAKLKALGNGVVVQQAVAAIRIGLARFAADDARDGAA